MPDKKNETPTPEIDPIAAAREATKRSIKAAEQPPQEMLGVTGMAPRTPAGSATLLEDEMKFKDLTIEEIIAAEKKKARTAELQKQAIIDKKK
jgi:hypothetical protein